MIKILAADLTHVSLIHALAHEIWPETYSSVLSQEQIHFMLEKSYSLSALSAVIESQQNHFFLLYEQKEAVGFIALKYNSQVTRIEKLYLKSGNQGKGYGAMLIEFAAKISLENKVQTLELNVHRANRAYHFYLKQGFKVVKTVDIPYYQFVLTDFVMQKNLIS